MRKPDQRIIQDWSKNDRLIVEFSFEKKMSEFDENDFIELDKRINQWQGFLGVKDIISDTRIRELLIYLRDYFSNFSIAEMEFAIKLGISGEMEIEDTQHYNNFGAQYLSKLFVGYKKLRNVVMTRYNKALDELLTQDAKAGVTELEKLQIAYNSTIAMFALYKKNNEVTDISNSIYNFLDRIEVIPFNADRRAQIRETAKAKYLELKELQAKAPQSKEESKNIKDLVEAVMNMSKTGEQILEYEYKKLSLHIYFAELVQMEVEIKDVLDEKLKQKQEA